MKFVNALSIAAVFLASDAALAATGSKEKEAAPVKIREEIRSNCGVFPYAPTIAMDGKTASLEDLKGARSTYDIYSQQTEVYLKCLLTLNRNLADRLTQKDVDYIIGVFNRTMEERDVLGMDFNKLVDEYNAANGIVSEEAPKPAAAKPAAKDKPAAKPATATKPAPAKP